MKIGKTIIIISSLIMLLCSCTSDGREKISGAGATFPAPFYNVVFREYAKLGGAITTYGGVGSGGGVRSLRDQTIDFGATDVFLSDKDLKRTKAEMIHVPTVLGGIVMAYNLKGIEELKLNSELITAIYSGEITRWNDEKIKLLNPTIDLPDKAITPVYRSDGSGTTAVFSEYMSKVNDTWKEIIGSGKSLNFPKGVAAKGNPGVAGIIAESEGSIGYIGSEYALALNIPTALLQNKAGNFIVANDKSISMAADIDIPEDTRTVITDSDNPEAYPICTFTWIIFYKEQNYNGRTYEQAKALKDLLHFTLSNEGQTIAVKTSYAPLSGKALEVARKAINRMTYNGQTIE